jgi:hypothetical protein
MGDHAAVIAVNLYGGGLYIAVGVMFMGGGDGGFDDKKRTKGTQ